MENEIIDKRNLIEKSIDILKKKKKLLFLFLFIFIIFSLVIFFFFYNQNIKNEKISEKYIKAEIYFSSNENEKSKLIYKDIVLSKNKFYSILALNKIIENNLEENSDEILKLFKIVEDIDLKREDQNLIKLKKALYLKKLSKNIEGNKLLKEIIADDSIWKEAVLEILK